MSEIDLVKLRQIVGENEDPGRVQGLEISGIKPDRRRLAEVEDGHKKTFKSLPAEFLESLRGLGPVFEEEQP